MTKNNQWKIQNMVQSMIQMMDMEMRMMMMLSKDRMWKVNNIQTVKMKKKLR